MTKFLMLLTPREVPVNTFKTWLARTFTVLAVTLSFNCGGSSPNGPPDPPIPCEPNNCPVEEALVVEFPGAAVDQVNRIVTITEGDSLGCSIALAPPNDNLVVGWLYDARPAICGSWGIGVPTFMAQFGKFVHPIAGEHTLDFLIQRAFDGKLLKTITYTLVVLPRPSG